MRYILAALVLTFSMLSSSAFSSNEIIVKSVCTPPKFTREYLATNKKLTITEITTDPELLSVLEEAGMGSVYVAEHNVINYIVDDDAVIFSTRNVGEKIDHSMKLVLYHDGRVDLQSAGLGKSGMLFMASADTFDECKFSRIK